MCSGSQAVTGLASGTPANEKEAYAHEFALTLSTTIKCDVPLPESCQANDNQLNASQWTAFRVSIIFSSIKTFVSQRYVVPTLIGIQHYSRQTTGGSPTPQNIRKKETKRRCLMNWSMTTSAPPMSTTVRLEIRS